MILYLAYLTWALLLFVFLWSLLDAIRMDKNNCMYWAVPRFLQRARAGEETYLVLRYSRMPYGLLHCLLGKLNPETGELVLTSYKPPAGHAKRRPALIFKGSVVQGDEAATKAGDLS